MKYFYIILFNMFCFVIKYTIINPDNTIMVKSIMSFLLIKTTKKGTQKIIINKYKDIVKLPFHECQLILRLITYHEYIKIKTLLGN